MNSASISVRTGPSGEPTLPDLLIEGLDLVFVGINPSVYSVDRGHYFARPGNRFWPCLSRSILSRRARAALAVENLVPGNDRTLQQYGIGFTDLVKRATPQASDLAVGEFAAGVEQLLENIHRYRPRVACFHGVTGYRHVHTALVGEAGQVALGLQDVKLGATSIFLVPNPSGANAHYTREDQTRWYDALAAYLSG